MSFQNYIDDMMKNHILDSESANDYNSHINNIHGGNNAYVTGGFPPIFLCADSTIDYDYEDDNDKKTRQYATHKNAVSIKQIIDKRKEVTPFISFNGIKHMGNLVKKTKKTKRIHN